MDDFKLKYFNLTNRIKAGQHASGVATLWRYTNLFIIIIIIINQPEKH